MILLLGASGYIGEAFALELSRRKMDFLPLSRQQVDYSRFDVLLGFLRAKKPAFVVNAAGFTGKPNVDACESDKAGTLVGNVLMPLTVANACAALGIPWGHVSSGCIFKGAKIRSDGRLRVECDLTRPDILALAEQKSPDILGFSEEDTPNFSFRAQPCSFYSGTKALGEEAIASIGQNYIWRLRIPFDELDNSRNYLSKLQRYAKVYENVNSISHRMDYVKACLDLLELEAPYGIYNVTNPGFVTTSQVVGLIRKFLHPGMRFEFWENDAEFYTSGVLAPRSNCVMDTSKLLAAGVTVRGVEEALEESLHNWKPEI